MDIEIQPVVVAGGAGTRLWPLSRGENPKQFLQIMSASQTMLQSTIQRLNGLVTCPPILICNEVHRFLAAEQLRVIGCEDVQIILEPEGRNTAPAIALAALNAVKKEGCDPLLLILASDHFIADVDAFHCAVNVAIPIAHAGELVTFGVVPTHPEIGYGYIEKGLALDLDGGFKIKRFVEKPDADVARNYFESGNFLWNSGMFLFKASRYLEELKRYAPEILESCELAIAESQSDLSFTRVKKEEFLKCKSDSIDYAVMEKTENAAVVPLNAGWSDVGGWSALADLSLKDVDGNACRGDSIIMDSSNSYVHASHRLVATIGVKNLIIVETKDAILVVNKDNVNDIKKLVEKLKEEGRPEHYHNIEVYRPWGKYESVDSGKRYQVKRITVNPGAKLSVQMHHHRAEHWIVVSGTAKVKNGEESYLLTENQSIYIPVGQVHSLENPGVIPLELIEVQSGSYLGEDDIVRLSDVYGRVYV